MTSPLPYRDNVGAVLFNAAGLVLVARRADLPNAEGAPGGWQLPQGGMDAGEDPAVAVFRELEEEIGTARAEILAEHPDWMFYDLPPDLLGKALGGRYRGQRRNGSRCASPGRIPTSASTLTRIRSSMPGAGPGWRSCRRWRWRSRPTSISGWRGTSRASRDRRHGPAGPPSATTGRARRAKTSVVTTGLFR
jgi:8-oxo-dGTP pyrophosphatase MutT (NUDIX family)